MIPSFTSLLGAALLMQLSINSVVAHMTLHDPPSLGYKLNPHTINVDYDSMSPMGDGKPFPCKGHLKKLGTSEADSTKTWAAGSAQSFTIVGNANHNGGSCQASLSYDRGATFKVIKSFVGGCPRVGSSQHHFTVPVEAPNGDAIFGWTWFNKVGNREMYMGCAAITITGSNNVGLGAFPEIYKANIPGYPTTPEGVDFEFPFPGSRVEKGSLAAGGSTVESTSTPVIKSSTTNFKNNNRDKELGSLKEICGICKQAGF